LQTIGIAASGKPINPAKHCGCPSPEIEYTNSLILWDLNGRPWRTILELFCSGPRGKAIEVTGAQVSESRPEAPTPALGQGRPALEFVTLQAIRGVYFPEISSKYNAFRNSLRIAGQVEHRRLGFEF